MMKYVVFILIIFIVLYLILTINQFVYLKKRIERSKAVVDVFLKKRYDLIPNLVEIVKGYIKYEKDTLIEINKLRNSFNSLLDKESEERLNEYYKRYLAVIEDYPEIKANANFLDLQKNLSKVESEIQASRRIYINDITNYNTKIQKFPNNLLANIFGFNAFELPLFESEDIKINFN